MVCDPSDLDVDPVFERGFRKLYIDGNYDALKGLRGRLTGLPRCARNDEVPCRKRGNIVVKSQGQIYKSFFGSFCSQKELLP
jgi:hypothetical protein